MLGNSPQCISSCLERIRLACRRVWGASSCWAARSRVLCCEIWWCQSCSSSFHSRSLRTRAVCRWRSCSWGIWPGCRGSRCELRPPRSLVAARSRRSRTSSDSHATCNRRDLFRRGTRATRHYSCSSRGTRPDILFRRRLIFWYTNISVILKLSLKNHSYFIRVSY